MSNQTMGQAVDCLAGGGDMGLLMRRHDWSQTQVGPVEGWPQSLRTAVRILLDSGYPMYIAWGADFVQFYNDAYRPILGSKHPDALGRSTRETFEEIWATIGPMFEQVMRHGEATSRDDQMLPLYRHGYVEECYFTFSYSAMREEAGRVGGVFVTTIETTARVVGERRLRMLRELGAAAAAAHSVEAACEEAMRVLARHPLDIPFALLYQVDDSGSTAELFDAIGLDDVPALRPPRLSLDDHEPLVWPIARAVKERAGETIEGGFTLVTGPWPEPCHTAVVKSISSASQSRGVAALVLGVSPRRHLDEDYRGFLELVAGHVASGMSNARSYELERKRADELAELDRAKTAFFTNVSHEFRTPLTLLLGPLEGEISNPKHSEATRENLMLAARNANRLLRLVNTLLDFSRIEAGRMEAVYEPVDLAAVTRDLSSVFRTTVEKAGLTFQVDCSPVSEPAYVDLEMWEKVVLNLLSNAFKFTFIGGIGVRLSQRNREAILQVQDTGVGIAAEELPRLFERFHRIRETRSRTHEGTGIGLALVMELVNLHKGTLTVDSEPGVGTTFTINLPLGSDHLPADRIGLPQHPTSVSPQAWRDELDRWQSDDGPVVQPDSRVRILLVDDNADMRHYVGRLLRRKWSVIPCEDGRQALQSAREAPPDLVLTDVMMPNLDGFALLRELRADERTRDIPVLMLSARAGEEARVEGLNAEADDYLVKPFSSNELMARVSNQLSMYRLRREATEREQQARLRAEQEHGRAQGEQHRLHSLLMQVPALICVLKGPNHVVVFANPLYRQVIGFRQEPVGKPLADTLPEELRPVVIDDLDQVYRSGIACQASERQGEGHLTERYFNFAYQATRDEGGNVDGILVHAVDVTDQTKAHRQVEALAQELREQQATLESTVRERTHELQLRTEELLAVNAQLQEIDRLKSDFLTTVSHELRTPLNAIIGFSHLMLSGGQLSPGEMDTYIRYIAEGGEQLLSLVNDILDLARIEAGRVDLEPRPMSLSSALEAAIHLVEPAARRKNIRVDRVIETEHAVADSQRFQQILLNILSNAVKFTPLNGRITLSAKRSGPDLRIAVTDTGVGIPESDLKRIFEAFERATLGTEGESGTGLGLAISGRLAKAHGGHIEVSSQMGNGSTFTLVLPQPE